MVDVGLLAYPVLLGAAVGALRIGRKQRWGEYEWMRLGALALVIGLVAAWQVKLLTLGLATQPLALAAALTSLACLGGLTASYLWERWQKAPARSVVTSG